MVQRIVGSTPKGPMEDRFNPSEEQTASVSVREYIDVFRRRRAIFIQTFLLILVISVVVTLLTPPVYQSRARLLVAGRSASLNSINTDNPLSALLAVFPFLIFGTALAGFLGADQFAETAVHLIFDTWPETIAKPLSDQVVQVLTIPRGGLLTISVLAAAYFASNGVEALRVSLNRAYRVAETRPWYVTRLVS